MPSIHGWSTGSDRQMHCFDHVGPEAANGRFSVRLAVQKKEGPHQAHSTITPENSHKLRFSTTVLALADDVNLNTCDRHGSTISRNCVGYCHPGDPWPRQRGCQLRVFADAASDAFRDDTKPAYCFVVRSLHGHCRDDGNATGRGLPAQCVRSFSQRNSQQPAAMIQVTCLSRSNRRMQVCPVTRMLHREARLPDSLHREGRGTRAARQRLARGLRARLHSVGSRASQVDPK